MRTIIILILNCVFVISALSQTTEYNIKTSDTAQAKSTDNINHNVNVAINQKEAYFSWGNDSLFSYIYSEIVYMENEIENHINGEIMLSFFVNFDGKVKDINVIQSIGYGIDEKISDIIYTLTFEPARMNNVPFRSQVFYSIPIQLRKQNTK